MTFAMASGSVAVLALLTLPVVASAAGNVVAAVVGGTLILTGDGGGNDVLVDQNGLAVGQLNVGGLGVTTVNGGASFVANGVTAGLVARLGDGNDNLIVSNAASFDRKVTMTTGAGDDTLTAVGTFMDGNTKIVVGNGNNEVRITNSTYEADLTVKAGSGDDVVDLTGTIVPGELTVALDGRSNQVTLP